MDLEEEESIDLGKLWQVTSSKHGLYSLDGQLQQGISKYPPDETATYLQLKSEAKTRKNIYTNLVQQREEDKVQ